MPQNYYRVESEDLVHWSEERSCHVGIEGPECYPFAVNFFEWYREKMDEICFFR